MLSQDIKQALYYLGEITGQVTTDDLLETIFDAEKMIFLNQYIFS